MKPCDFPEKNVVFAKDQKEYLPLPAYRSGDGRVISCWSLSWRERLVVLLRGRLWLSVLTFNQPLQPLLPQTDYPFIRE